MRAPARRRPAQGGPQSGDRVSRSRSREPAGQETQDDVDGAAGAGPSDAAPGVLPPLARDGLPRLVERFRGLGFHLPKNVDNFVAEDARINFNAHLQTWGLDKTDVPHPRGGAPAQGLRVASAARPLQLSWRRSRRRRRSSR